MEDKNNKPGNADEKLDALFKAASDEIWNPMDGFDARVLARIEDEQESRYSFGTLAWKILPFAAAASILIAIAAFGGESLNSIINSEITDPLAIESMVTLIM
jgi:hypothetical protein